MTYQITKNPQFNSLEITFDGKPSEAVRSALKQLRFRWHSIKKCWYGYTTENKAVEAILSASTEEEHATVITDGYLGGGAVYGSKSHLRLYGADLANAIRHDLKAAGIKGVTIARKNGNIIATVKIAADDIVPEADFVRDYVEKGAFGWVDYTDENGCYRSVALEDFGNLPADLRERIRTENAKKEYAKFYTHPASLNHYYLDTYTGFSAKGLAKIEAVNSLISQYRYDDSNGMVDYFDTNFYYDIYTKPALEVSHD